MGDIFDTKVTSPIARVDSSQLINTGISLSVKREDLIHPDISGNKWRKLKYNLKAAVDKELPTVVSFGGAFSNHIYALASACKVIGIKSVGIIRGEYDEKNPTTKHAIQCGMELRFVCRNEYRDKNNSPAVKSILSEFPNHILIPEGGSNELAQIGLSELSNEINQSHHDVILVSAGTGATATGIIKNLRKDKELWVFSSLKSDYLKNEILKNIPTPKHDQLKFIDRYHFGGYGKTPIELISFINEFTKETGIPVDPIYNGKLMCGFFDMIDQGLVDNTKSYLWIHTGGLQGIRAYNYIAIKKNKPRIL